MDPSHFSSARGTPRWLQREVRVLRCSVEYFEPKGASQKEVIKVVVCVYDSLLRGSPFYGLGQAVEDEGGRPKSKGENPIEEGLPLPLHTLEVVV